MSLPALLTLAIICSAQVPSNSSTPSPSPAHPSARYQFGAQCNANPQWASPSFDDSGWQTMEPGLWPKPAYPADGIICARFIVPIPAAAASPLALRQTSSIQSGSARLSAFDLPSANEIYVNGTLVIRRGLLPPDPTSVMQRGQTVFPIPVSLVAPNAPTALVAVRLWLQPYAVLDATPGLWFDIDRADVSETAAREESESRLLSVLPIVAAFAVLLILGIGLIIFWRLSGDRDLLLFGFTLICLSTFILFMTISRQGYFPLSRRQWDFFYAPVQFLAPFSGIFFAWNFLNVPSRSSKWLAYAFCVTMAISAFLKYWFYTPYEFIPALDSIEYWANFVMGLFIIGAGLWGLAFRPGKRLVAFVLILNPLASNVGMTFKLPPIVFGSFAIGALSFTTLITGLVMGSILARGAWKNWRGSSTLRKEMDAAREVQQQLVGTMPETPGFAVRAAYLPASQVGGDFYRITPLASGGLLIIVGDVSGKGLRAAMTVSAIMGALRAIASESPGTILTLLNHALEGQLHGGFVTCCIVRLNSRGEARIANAGHLPPYISGREMDLPPSLPLGLVPGNVYSESTFQLAAGERFTVLSDGVVEARDSNGEMLGFERTAILSSDTADQIAREARKFGQEDDITVVTVAYLRGLM